MELSRFFWFSGVALLVGGAFYSISWIVFALSGIKAADNFNHSLWVPLNLMVIAGSILMAAGMPGLHISQAGSAGIAGLAGIAAMFVGLLLAGAAGQAVETFTLPHLGRVPAEARIIFNIAGPLLFTGIVLTGIATWQAGVYPRWAAAALIGAALAGLAATFLPLPPVLRWGTASLYSMVIALLGYLLLLAGPQLEA
jgi:hypothetical protein